MNDLQLVPIYYNGGLHWLLTSKGTLDYLCTWWLLCETHTTHIRLLNESD